MQRFTDKTVIVTGASSGIGAAAARRFASEGANVVLNARSQEDLEALGADLDPARTLCVAGDIAQIGFPDDLVARTVAKFGGLDVLYANAGVATSGPFGEASDEDIDRVIDINVKGSLRCARAAYPELKKSKGAIVFTSSASGIGGDYNMVIYTASKGAVTQMTRSMALEWGQDGIRVNAVCPSMTRTKMAGDLMENPAIQEAFYQRAAIKRFGEPEDVADVVAFLASDDARFVTGVNLPVDGGVSASNGQPNFPALS
ncbi:SDR family NAD(P)-dependent oxidoreductase [Novosphingobium mangrovi (ex Hu et al. 2023)]|uniref:Glucose 1-dehydrogenase n=1 Tax=Novosphingobium mangrovi (ex Hu et al. 2023) TaxID=2930094 RepID=A0ABT0AHM8_9SPHN|nr:glucose 1-dehydrogenase [Novosphingobium mangrovi (ex Hu et al. 2023)]MCJ1962692.1 glucose 1-dehydrogenase [Novosphingobium mangrovi (ex Hu et al. 2023)]